MPRNEQGKAAMEAIAARVFALRLTDAEFCAKARTQPSSYSRAKAKGAGPVYIRELEKSLDAIEADRAGA